MNWSSPARLADRGGAPICLYLPSSYRYIFKILQQVLYQLTLSLIPIITNKIYKVISLVVIQGKCCFVECFSGRFRELFISALQFHNQTHCR